MHGRSHMHDHRPSHPWWGDRGVRFPKSVALFTHEVKHILDNDVPHELDGDLYQDEVDDDDLQPRRVGVRALRAEDVQQLPQYALRRGTGRPDSSVKGNKRGGGRETKKPQQNKNQPFRKQSLWDGLRDARTRAGTKCRQTKMINYRSIGRAQSKRASGWWGAVVVRL